MHYHPDRKPAEVNMMKMIDVAYDVLKDYSGVIASSDHQNTDSETTVNYSEAVNEALSSIINLEGLNHRKL